MTQLAEFERDLEQRLAKLRTKLRRGDGWFAGLPLGAVWVVPKKSRPLPDGSEKIEGLQIGLRAVPSPPADLDVQVRFTPSPDVAIVEILYLWKCGPAIDSTLPRESIGYRLDLRRGQLSKTRRWVFQYWPDRYQEFRTAPLEAAKAELASAGSVVAITTADLASFYDTVDSSFLLSEEVVTRIERSGEGAPRGYIEATSSLISMLLTVQAIGRPTDRDQLANRCANWWD